MKKTIALMLFAALTFITACDDESPFSGYAVNFTFDKSIHPYNQVNKIGRAHV